MQRDRMLRALASLGIRPTDHRVLLVLPLVYVAWAKGTVGTVERERIMELASEHLELSPRALAVLRRWLEERPSEVYFREGLIDLVKLLRAPDQLDVESDNLQQLLIDGEDIAREAQHDPTWQLDERQRAALVEMELVLHVDTGEPWNDLLDELGDFERGAPPTLRTRPETHAA